MYIKWDNIYEWKNCLCDAQIIVRYNYETVENVDEKSHVRKDETP